MNLMLLSSTRNKPGNACISQAYIKAAMVAGLPMVAAGCNPHQAEEYAAAAAGLILTGGGDIDPVRFGQPLHPKAELVEAEQDEFDFALFHAFRRAGKPIFGICRGVQVINVALGGDLIQHIPDAYQGIQHTAEGNESFHKVLPVGESFLGIAGPTEVNSMHHQAIGVLGEGLRAVAAAEDGVVEAVQSEDGLILGVQWHPERYDSDLSKRIFNCFANMIL